MAAPLVSAEDEAATPAPTRAPSLAERAEAARKQAEAAGKGRDQKSGGRVLNNEDLKKAKGNVIYLQTPAPPPAPARISSSSSAAPSDTASEVPVAPCGNAGTSAWRGGAAAARVAPAGSADTPVVPVAPIGIASSSARSRCTSLARVAPARLCGGHCGSDPLLPASEGGCPAAAGVRGSVDRFARLPRAGILAPAQTWTGCRCQSRPPNLVWPQPRFHRKPISQALCRIQELTIMIQRFSAKRGWLREIYQLVGIIQTPIPNK